MDPSVATPPLDRLVADLAEKQHGVVEHQQLLRLGLSATAIKRRLAAGRLHRIHLGVYAVGHRKLTARGRWMAAVLACGPGAVLSHQTAAALWNIRPSSSPALHVTVPTLDGRRRPGIKIHRTRSLPAHEIGRRDGIAITSVARTLLDLTDVVGVPDLRKALERSEDVRLLDLREIQAVMAEHPGRRTKKLEQALDQADFGFKRSPLESDFLALCKRFGLPRPEVNVEVAGHEVDFYFRDQGLVVETDGWTTHGTRRAFETDRRRDIDYAKHGLQHIRLTHDRIAGEPADVAGDVSSLLAL